MKLKTLLEQLKQFDPEMKVEIREGGWNMADPVSVSVETLKGGDYDENDNLITFNYEAVVIEAGQETIDHED